MDDGYNEVPDGYCRRAFVPTPGQPLPQYPRHAVNPALDGPFADPGKSWEDYAYCLALKYRAKPLGDWTDPSHPVNSSRYSSTTAGHVAGLRTSGDVQPASSFITRAPFMLVSDERTLRNTPLCVKRRVWPLRSGRGAAEHGWAKVSGLSQRSHGNNPHEQRTGREPWRHVQPRRSASPRDPPLPKQHSDVPSPPHSLCEHARRRVAACSRQPAKPPRAGHFQLRDAALWAHGRAAGHSPGAAEQLVLPSELFFFDFFPRYHEGPDDVNRKGSFGVSWNDTGVDTNAAIFSCLAFHIRPRCAVLGF